MNNHGYTCKTCGHPSPTGVGYVDTTPGAFERSQNVTECECGASRAPVVDGLSRYALRNVTAGQADVYDMGQWVHRGTVYRIVGQPIDLDPVGGMWGVLYPDNTRAGAKHLNTASSEAHRLIAKVAMNALGASTLAFRTRADAAQFALLTF